MKMRIAVAAITLAATSFFVAAAAQNAGHHPAEATEQGWAMMNGMHQGMGYQMMQAIAQVRSDLAALANQSDVTAIHGKLAEDAKLLEQFQGHMSGWMQGMGGSMMQGMMSGNMTGSYGCSSAGKWQQPQR